MRLILYLVLAYCSVCVNSESYATNNGEKTLVKAYLEGNPSQRQFIGHLRKWIFGRFEGKEQSKSKPKTTVKYLPIYVPVPVYSDTKVPSEAYGAHHQQNQKEYDQEEKETIIPLTKPGLPYPHTQSYNLPYASQLYHLMNRQGAPMYYMPYREHLTKPAQEHHPNPYYSPYYGAYEYVYENSPTYSQPETNDYDSEVIDNPELVTDPDKDRDGEVYTRKRKRYKTNKAFEEDDDREIFVKNKLIY